MARPRARRVPHRARQRVTLSVVALGSAVCLRLFASFAPAALLGGGLVNGAGEGSGVVGLRVARALGLACSCAQTRHFVARESRETCIARQHRRQGRALSYYACSSCVARQASPFRPGLSCCAGSGRVRSRPLPSSSQRRLPSRSLATPRARSAHGPRVRSPYPETPAPRDDTQRARVLLAHDPAAGKRTLAAGTLAHIRGQDT